MIFHKDVLSDHQTEFPLLDETRPLATVTDRCPFCHHESLLWRVFDDAKSPGFFVKCTNQRCLYQVPEKPLRNAREAVAAWRLSIILQNP